MQDKSTGHIAWSSHVASTSSGARTLEVGIGAGEDNAVLHLAGEFDLSNIEAAEAGLTDALARSEQVVIDLSDLTYIDSTGIAFLVKAARKLGPQLTVHESDHPEVKRTFDLVGLRALFAGPS